MTCHCFRKKRWTSFNNIFCIKMLPDGNNNSQKIELYPYSAISGKVN